MQPEKEVRTDERRLILGYDGGCFTCSDLASRIEDRLEGKIEIRNLRDPEVRQWRKQALGDDAPWAPTLFEIKSAEVRAWTGWKMAANMSRLLGPVASWRVMEELGEAGAAPPVERGGMSRGRFLKGVGGAAVAMSVLSGGLAFSSIASAQTSSNGTLEQRRRVRSIVLNSRSYKGLANQQTQIGASFDWSSVEVRAASNNSTLSLQSVSSRRTVIAVFMVNRSRGTVRFLHTMAFASSGEQDKVMSWTNSNLVDRYGELYIGDDHVIISDNRLMSHQQFVDEINALGGRSAASGSYNLQSVGICTDAEFQAAIERNYKVLVLGKQLLCSKISKSPVGRTFKFVSKVDAGTALCSVIHDGYLQGRAQQAAFRDCAPRENYVAQAPPVSQC